MGTTQTFIGWEPITQGRDAFISAWPARQAEARARPEVSSAQLFDVVEGDCLLLCLYELAAGSADQAAAALAGAHSGSSATPDRRIYGEVFRAPGARSFADTNDYLFAVRADIEPPEDADFERWYNEVHVPDVASVGLERARRFHAAGAGPKYLATYEISSPAVMETEELRRVRGFHEFTPYVKDIKRWVLQPLREGADAGT